MIYFDTAYLAKCYLTDTGFEDVRRLAALHPVATCELGRVEMAAAFHRACREGRLTAAALQIIRRQFASDDALGVWVWLPATSALLKKAAQRFDTLRRDTFLRSADAIHLTCAAEHGFPEIYSNDRHLLAAAPLFGLKPRNVIAQATTGG